MRHEDGGRLARAALPGEEQAVSSHALRRAALVQEREALTQQGAEFLELGLVLKAVVEVRDGAAAYHGGEVLRDLFSVHPCGVGRGPGLALRLEGQGARSYHASQRGGGPCCPGGYELLHQTSPFL